MSHPPVLSNPKYPMPQQIKPTCAGGTCFFGSNQPVVVCEICGQVTQMDATKRCDRCWELERRINADPRLAVQIIRSIAYDTPRPMVPIEDLTQFLNAEYGEADDLDLPSVIRELLDYRRIFSQPAPAVETSVPILESPGAEGQPMAVVLELNGFTNASETKPLDIYG